MSCVACSGTPSTLPGWLAFKVELRLSHAYSRGSPSHSPAVGAVLPLPKLAVSNLTLANDKRFGVDVPFEIIVEHSGNPISWNELIELKPLSSSVAELSGCWCCLNGSTIGWKGWCSVTSSSVSTLPDEVDAAEEEEVDTTDELEVVECTELSVELRNDRRESRMLFARRKSISAVALASELVAAGTVRLLCLSAAAVALTLLLALFWAGVMCVVGIVAGFATFVCSVLLHADTPLRCCVKSGWRVEVLSRLCMVRERRKASWLSFSSRSSAAAWALDSAHFLGERRL